MSFRRVVVAYLTVVASHSVWAQLPASKNLSAEDQRELNTQLARLKDLLPTANDKAAIELQIATGIRWVANMPRRWDNCASWLTPILVSTYPAILTSRFFVTREN